MRPIVRLTFLVLSVGSAGSFAAGSESCASAAPIQDKALIDELDDAIRRAAQNSAPEKDGTNFEGHAWETLLDDGDGIVVETSQSSSSRFNLFRSTMVLRCDDKHEKEDKMREIIEPLFDVERRRDWDPQIRSGRVISSDRPAGSDVSVRVVRYGTAVALGGLVKSRLFTDVAATKRMDGEILCASIAWDLLNHKSALGLAESDLALDAAERGMIVAMNMKGGCARVTALGGTDYSFTAVGFTDIGGWLPPKIVNSQSAQSFRDMSESLAKRLGATIVAGTPASSLAP